MNVEKNITVAFTGHRNYNRSADTELRELLEALYADGYRRFLCGMAWGFDLAAAEAVVKLRAEHSDVQLIAVEPFADFRKLFRGEDAERYERVKAAADKVVVVGERGDRMDYILRNDYLVANASAIVAWWNGAKHGGTAYTVKQARKAKILCYNLCDRELPLF